MNNFGTASGQKTADALILTGPGALLGVDLTPPSSGSAVLVVYDSENSTIASKTILTEVHVDAGFTGVNHEYFLPVAVNRGIYCTLTGTGSNFYVRYMKT